jgi:hypothetical protein
MNSSELTLGLIPKILQCGTLANRTQLHDHFVKHPLIIVNGTKDPMQKGALTNRAAIGLREHGARSQRHIRDTLKSCGESSMLWR